MKAVLPDLEAKLLALTAKKGGSDFVSAHEAGTIRRARTAAVNRLLARGLIYSSHPGELTPTGLAILKAQPSPSDGEVG